MFRFLKSDKAYNKANSRSARSLLRKSQFHPLILQLRLLRLPSFWVSHHLWSFLVYHQMRALCLAPGNHQFLYPTLSHLGDHQKFSSLFLLSLTLFSDKLCLFQSLYLPASCAPDWPLIDVVHVLRYRFSCFFLICYRVWPSLFKLYLCLFISINYTN